MGIPKPKESVGFNIYFLHTYVDQRLASFEHLWEQGKRALRFQEANRNYDNQCWAANQCPLCDSEIEAQDDCDDHETRR